MMKTSQPRDAKKVLRRVIFPAAFYVEALEPRCLLSTALLSNIQVTTDAGAQQQPSVAVDPHAPLHVAIVYMDSSLVTTGYAGLSVSFSHDGGATWNHSAIPLPTGFDQGAANPVAKFDDHGHLFVTYMAATFLAAQPTITNPASGPPRVPGFQSNNGIFVSRSDDGGVSWQAAAVVTSHLYDGQTKVPFEIIPDLAIDTFSNLPNGQANPLYGDMYVTWSRYYPAGQFPGEASSHGGSDIMIAASIDNGQTWQTRMETWPANGAQVSALESALNEGNSPPQGYGYVNWAHPSIGPEGDVYVSDFNGSAFFVNHSTDNAQTFFVPTQADSLGLPFGVGPRELDFGLSNNNFRL